MSLMLISCGLTACASTPPVRTNYYPAKTIFHVKTIRTVACDATNMPVVASTVTATSTHSADLSKPMTFALKDVDGPLANSDLKVEFYPDGRLNGLNATTTGQGETILKSIISLAAVAADRNLDQAPVIEACKKLKLAFADKPLTLAFERVVDFANMSEISLLADAQSQQHYAKYRTIVGDSCIRFQPALEAKKPVELTATGNNYVTLTARQPKFIPVSVWVGPAGGCGTSQIWGGLVPVAQLGQDYDIPVPRAAAFGKQIFAAKFDESGALTLLQYGKETGAAGAVTVMQSAFDAANETDAEKIAQLKGEADIIAAQQRLVKCQTTPANC